VLLQQCPLKFAPLLTDESTLQSFVSQNGPALEALATQLKALDGAQSELVEVLDKLSQSVTHATKLSDCQICSCFETLRGQVKLADQCPLIAGFEASAKSAQEKGDIYLELKLKSISKYLRTSKNVPWYKFLRGMIAPRRDGWCGDDLEAISTFVATNANGSFELFFKSIVDVAKSHAILLSDVNTIKTNLSKEWEHVQKSAAKANEARVNTNKAFQQIKLHYDDFNFNRVRENYNPLDIYLSNYNYL